MMTRYVARWRGRPEPLEVVAERAARFLAALLDRDPALDVRVLGRNEILAPPIASIAVAKDIATHSIELAGERPVRSWSYFGVFGPEGTLGSFRLTAEGPIAYQLPLASAFVVEMANLDLASGRELDLLPMIIFAWDPESVDIASGDVTSGVSPVPIARYTKARPDP
jgi:hypothetical protein